MKKLFAAGLGLWMVGSFFSGATALAGEDPLAAEDKANKIHAHASTDMIYSQEETKALYYQNIVIIDLLRQIRDLLDSRLKPTTEK